MRKNKYCVELDGVDCSFPDRYMGCGYGKSYTIPEMFERVATVDKITGIELVSNWQITPENASEMKKYATDLRALTNGRGTFDYEITNYEEAPQIVADKVIAEANK